MRKVFKLQDLDCANCAAKMEDAIKKIDGVNTASMSFMTQKLVIDAEPEKMDAILDEAEKICHKIEPDMVILRWSAGYRFFSKARWRCASFSTVSVLSIDRSTMYAGLPFSGPHRPSKRCCCCHQILRDFKQKPNAAHPAYQGLMRLYTLRRGFA